MMRHSRRLFIFFLLYAAFHYTGFIIYGQLPFRMSYEAFLKR